MSTPTNPYPASKNRLVSHSTQPWNTKYPKGHVPLYFNRQNWNFYCFPDPDNLEGILVSTDAQGLSRQLEEWPNKSNQVKAFVWRKVIWVGASGDWQQRSYGVAVGEEGRHPILGIRYRNTPKWFSNYNAPITVPYTAEAEKILVNYVAHLNLELKNISTKEGIEALIFCAPGVNLPPLSKRFKHLEMD